MYQYKVRRYTMSSYDEDVETYSKLIQGYKDRISPPRVRIREYYLPQYEPGYRIETSIHWNVRM